MSMMRCEHCECFIDTDEFPETFRGGEVPAVGDDCICDTCWYIDPRNPERLAEDGT